MLTGKDYCDYDTSVALRELGYVGICDAYYELTGNDSYNRDSFELLYTRDFIHPDDKDRVAAPSLYQAQKWLREERGILLQPTYLELSDKWVCVIRDKNKRHGYSAQKQKHYEEALSEGIKEAVKILKNQ